MRILVVMLLGLSILVASCTQHKAETTLVYRADLSAWVGSEDEAMTESISVIRARLDALDLQGATVKRLGTDQIVVRSPNINNIDEVVALIGSTGQLEFKELIAESWQYVLPSINPGYIPDYISLTNHGLIQWVPATAVDSSGKEVALTGQYLKRNARLCFSQFNNAPEVAFEFNSEGANLFSQITGRLIDEPLGIFLDSKLISSPTVKAQIESSAVISGISLDEARNLVIVINSGAIPCLLTLVSKHVLTPTLSTPSPAITWQQPVATINDTTISMDYFIKMLRFYSLTSRGNTSSPTFPYQVLKWIENDELIRQAAPGLGINVSPDEIVAKINDDMIPMAGGGWNSTGNITGSITLPQSDIGKAYQQWLDYVCLSDSEYRYLVEANLLQQKIIDYFTQSVPTEAKQIHVYAIRVDNEGNATEVENRLQNGDNFATVAAEFSTDETTKQFGGDLGWMPQDILPPELDQAAFSLAVGSVSEPIVATTGNTTGYYIIKVAEIDESRPIHEQYRQFLACIAFSNWLMEQRKVVEIREYLDQTTATWAMNQIS